MDKVEGVVERITYQNEESGYGVIKIRANGFSELLTLTGKFVEMNIGTVIEANGDFVVNKKFGKHMAKAVDIAILVGVKRSEPIVAGLREEKFDDQNIYIVANLDEATQKLAKISKLGDVVLFENDLPDNYNE